jgi:hypothetical protein
MPMVSGMFYTWEVKIPNPLEPQQIKFQKFEQK